MEKAVNLCDVGYRLLNANAVEGLIASYSRIYVGSYFCDRYFLMTTPLLLDSLKNSAQKGHRKITLVVPVPSQTTLTSVKKMVSNVLRKYKKVVDTVVVNDLGMLDWLSHNSNTQIVLGRMFSKCLRDPRYPETSEAYTVPKSTEQIIQQYNCGGIEVEGCFHAVYKSNFDLRYAIHLHASPFYISCMRQCFFASIPKVTSQKFRQNAGCRLECSEYRLSNTIQRNAEIHRIGKGVYFAGSNVLCTNSSIAIIIEMPIDMW